MIPLSLPMKIKALLPGDLVKVISTDLNMTLCYNPRTGANLSACAVQTFDESNVVLEGKLGLVVGMTSNRLEQTTDYYITIEDKKYKCRAILADRYLVKV